MENNSDHSLNVKCTLLGHCLCCCPVIVCECMWRKTLTSTTTLLQQQQHQQQELLCNNIKREKQRHRAISPTTCTIKTCFICTHSLYAPTKQMCVIYRPNGASVNKITNPAGHTSLVEVKIAIKRIMGTESTIVKKTWKIWNISYFLLRNI